jgi:hypothetical protein
VDQLGNYPIARNLNEFLANFYFFQLLQVYTGCNDATSVCMWVVVVQQVYVCRK